MEPLEASTKRKLEVAADCDVWRLNLKLLPRIPYGYERTPQNEFFNFYGYLKLIHV